VAAGLAQTNRLVRLCVRAISSTWEDGGRAGVGWSWEMLSTPPKKKKAPPSNEVGVECVQSYSIGVQVVE
jgi:hypothetical protein